MRRNHLIATFKLREVYKALKALRLYAWVNLLHGCMRSTPRIRYTVGTLAEFRSAQRRLHPAYVHKNIAGN